MSQSVITFAGRPAGSPASGGFSACANCARTEETCICAGTDVAPAIQRYTGVTLRRPALFTPAMQRKIAASLAPARPTGKPATISVAPTAKGWNIMLAQDGELLPFVMELPECEAEHRVGRDRCAFGYHAEHVARLLAEIAKTLPRGTKVPEVPVRLRAVA